MTPAPMPAAFFMSDFLVVVDGRYLVGERKGIGRYLRTLLAGMATLADRPDFVFVTDGRGLLTGIPAELNYDVITVKSPLVYTWEQFALPRAVAAFPGAVFHAPGNALPWRVPPRTVLTLHDCMMFQPAFHTFAANRYYVYQSVVLKSRARRCAAIITVSATSAEDIRQHIGAGTLVEVIPEAVDPMFFRQVDPGLLAAFRARYNIPETYLLHLGAAFPRKNTRLVIEAYGAAASRREMPALVIGGVSAEDAVTVKRWASELAAGKAIHVVGYLNDEEHSLLMAGAFLLIYPSAYEGFGLPALEAMACGVPVLTSPRGALPETCGDAAYYTEPELSALTEALTFLVGNDYLRAVLVTRGRERVRRFGGAEMAARTLAVYRAAAEGNL